MTFERSRGEALSDLRKILFRPNANIFAAKTHVKPKNQKTGQFTKVKSTTFSPLAKKFLDERKPPKHTYPRALILITSGNNASKPSARQIGTIGSKAATPSCTCLAVLDGKIRQESPQNHLATQAGTRRSRGSRSLLRQKFNHFGEKGPQLEFEGHGVHMRSNMSWDKNGSTTQNEKIALDKTLTSRKNFNQKLKAGKGLKQKPVDAKELKQNSMGWKIPQLKVAGKEDLQQNSMEPKLTTQVFERSCKPMDDICQLEEKLLHQSNAEWKALKERMIFKEITPSDGKKFSRITQTLVKDKEGLVLAAKFRKENVSMNQLNANIKKENPTVQQQDVKGDANRIVIERLPIARAMDTQTGKLMRNLPLRNKIDNVRNLYQEFFSLYGRDASISPPQHQHDLEKNHRKTLGERDLNLQQAQQEADISPLHKLRKGKLSSKLVKTIWGPTVRKQSGEDEKREAEVDELIKKIQKRKEEAAKKNVECLMDVLLKNWIYFQHSYTTLNFNYVKKDVHAKYCKGAFGHYLVSDGSQVHGSYNISLRQLISELKFLMLKLKGRLFKSSYKETPKWMPPKLEQLPEFSAPEQPPMPKLYPIQGFTSVPEDVIPLDTLMPLLKTPRLQAHPTYIPPKLHRKPMSSFLLDLPPIPDFTEEEKVLAKPPTDVPIPSFKIPELLSLPIWEEPQEQMLPPKPQNEVAKVMDQLVMEVLPPYEPPKQEKRPCETSYYYGAAENGQIPICDGLCGRLIHPWQTIHEDFEGNKENETFRDTPCLAKRPKLLSIPEQPSDNELPEPNFSPPIFEILPPFIPPKLQPLPKYVGPSNTRIPQWASPPPPLPIGYLMGQRPVFLIDCSSSMAGNGFIAALDAIRHLFSIGGQVEIAATHFDIIMFSFDAWSFGACMEEEKHNQIYKEASRYWLQNLQLMQAKTPENMEKALQWVSKWGTNGTSNLIKAMEVAMAQTSADCIYLFTRGKCDRPVIIMDAMKELEISQRKQLTRIFPIGIKSTQAQARILKSVLADITGGQFIKLDLKWKSELYHRQKEASEDEKWLQSELEFWQRENMLDSWLATNPHRMDIIMDHLKWQFEQERIIPCLAAYQKEDEKARVKHQIVFERVQAENEHILSMSHNAYEKAHAIILGKNKRKSQDLALAWESELKRVRKMNFERRELHRSWEEKVRQIKEANHTSEEEGKQRFLEDLRRIEERNAKAKFHGKSEHENLVKKLKELNDHRKNAHQKQQDTLISRLKTKNTTIWKAYEDQCAMITDQNAQIAEKAQEEYTAACEAVIKQNHKKMRDAESGYKEKIEIIATENAKRKAEHLSKLEALETKKSEARRLHHNLFAKKVAEHKASLADIAALNNSLELEAKHAWEESCKRVDVENKDTTKKAYQEWGDAAHQVQLQNEQLARRRMDLQLRRDQVERMNTEIVQNKKANWKDACHRMELLFHEEVARSKLHYKQMQRELQVRNEQILEAAKEAFEAKKSAIELHNKSIQPQVEASALVQREIDKIREFLGCIVSQSQLPPQKKHAKKRTLEQSLDMLAALDSPCPPKMIIAALQAALASDMEKHSQAPNDLESSTITKLRPAGGQEPYLEQQQCLLSELRQGKFSNMVPIDPPRVSPHSCKGVQELHPDLRGSVQYHNPKTWA